LRRWLTFRSTQIAVKFWFLSPMRAFGHAGLFGAGLNSVLESAPPPGAPSCPRIGPHAVPQHLTRQEPQHAQHFCRARQRQKQPPSCRAVAREVAPAADGAGGSSQGPVTGREGENLGACVTRAQATRTRALYFRLLGAYPWKKTVLVDVHLCWWPRSRSCGGRFSSTGSRLSEVRGSCSTGQPGASL
jgi:hypothetical protein